ncbi:MAG TPA: YggS family pyridoxal phosphate-dependent enzyme [Gaiellales bacterium]
MWACLADPDVIRENLARVRSEVGDGVEILAATKYVDADELPALREAGVELVGENRSDALIAKQERFGDLFTWDFIGHVQSRKVKDIVGRVRLIHAIDSVSACRRMQDAVEGPVACLLQVNAAGEESKSGVATGEVDAFLGEIQELDRVVFHGLMTMPPLAEKPDDARPWFASLRDLRDRLAPEWSGRHDFRHLSMGTSQDYRAAAAEGATIVRVGSVLYGR